jgi:hypothetical protein
MRASAPGPFLCLPAEKHRALLAGGKAQLSFSPLGPAQEAAEKVCAVQESNTSGAKALIFAPFTARLKSCPDTKHEFFRSL